MKFSNTLHLKSLSFFHSLVFGRDLSINLSNYLSPTFLSSLAGCLRKVSSGLLKLRSLAMEELLNPLPVTHLLQHTLRSLCIHKSSHWLYAVFWRILPRNYPPPKWDSEGGIYDRTRGNRRNWILAWEDGFCNFAAASCSEQAISRDTITADPAASSNSYDECSETRGLQPELFFKMSHEIYNYGEGLIGKVAADHSHKWVFKEAQDHKINLISSWNNPADCQPRTWEAQFHSGIKTIALIAVKEGVVQLGSTDKVMEDLGFVIMLRSKFDYLQSIPGVLLPHPLSAPCPVVSPHWPSPPPPRVPPVEFYEHFAPPPMWATPSMSSLEALLSKLPPVVGPPAHSVHLEMPVLAQPQKGVAEGNRRAVTAKKETEEDSGVLELAGECSSSMFYYATVNKADQGL